MGKFTQVIKRSGVSVPFNQDRITNAIYRAAISVGGRDKEKAAILSDKVVDELEKKFPDGYKPHIEEIQDVVEKVLIESGHAKVAKEYILYREESRRRRESDAKYSKHPSENIPWAKIWHVLEWSVTNRLNTIDSMNERIRNGEFPNIVNESEVAYEDDVENAAELIIKRTDELKMVIITGPSSSGKTTTTIKLEERLKKSGFKFVPLIIDNYFYDLEMHPKDEFGDYDFETPQALDLKLINEHLLKLCEGEEVLIPFYDFKSGKRKLNQTPVRIREDEILLIDSLHGLFPAMTADVPNELKFRLYLEPLLQMKGPNGRYIKWTDLRLIRRMLRDAEHRAYKPQQTLEHWHYVRSSEMRNIIPYLNTADYIINSAMPYEIALYAAKLTGDFELWEKKYKDDPLRQDAYLRASRIYNMLKSTIPVEDNSPVPEHSVLREFIGGSCYSY